LAEEKRQQGTVWFEQAVLLVGLQNPGKANFCLQERKLA
jgi:hypothetical protein